MNTLIAINDLKRHTKPLADAIKAKVGEVVDSGWFVLGTEVELFEKNFAAYCGSQHCVSVANGTEALEIALRSLGIKAGNKVASVANAGMYSTTAIEAVGAETVFVDIELNGHNISIEDLKKKISENKIDAIIVTHLYGQLANIKEIVSLGAKHNIPIIEDCAQAHGASLYGKKSGSFGTIGCYSFYPTKNLGALGDGGALVTNNSDTLKEILLLRQYGWSGKYNVVKKGCKNSRLDEIQASILNLKLPYLDQWNSRRRSIVQKISENCIEMEKVSFPYCFDESYVGHLFVVRTKFRDELKSFLKSKSIPSDIHYPTPDHKQPVCREKYNSISLPVTEKAALEILTLPCFPEMDDSEIDYISNCLLEFEKWSH